MRPCELVLPSNLLSEATRKVLKAALRSPRTSEYSTADNAEGVIEMLEEKSYFAQWPEFLKVFYRSSLLYLAHHYSHAYRPYRGRHASPRSSDRRQYGYIPAAVGENRAALMLLQFGMGQICRPTCFSDTVMSMSTCSLSSHMSSYLYEVLRVDRIVCHAGTEGPC